MSHTISDARKRVNEVCHCGRPVVYGFDGDPTHTRGLCEHCDDVRCDAYPGECERPAPPPTVPRLARSVDDLRVGMVVAVKPQNSGWENQDSTVREVTVEWWETASYYFHDPGNVVILSDPPARDWLVPATQMEALADSLIERNPQTSPKCRTATVDWVWLNELQKAARAVLDAAREVEHE